MTLPAERAPGQRTTDDAASEVFLQQRIDAAVEEESQRAEAERLERLRWNQEQRAIQRVYVTRYRTPYHHDRVYGRSYVPWNAIVLGGVGAAIGHRHGHRHGGPRGFLIGSSIGFVLDSLRW
jgi:hypothetical protein